MNTKHFTISGRDIDPKVEDPYGDHDGKLIIRWIFPFVCSGSISSLV